MGPPEGNQLVEWIRWLKERPESVRKVVAKVPPWKVYRFKFSKAPVPELVSIVAYCETEDDVTGREGAVTLRVNVNSPTFPRQVFGIKPEDLEPVHEPKETTS